MRAFVWVILVVVLLLLVPVKVYLLADGAVSIKFGWLFFCFGPKKETKERPPKAKSKKKKRAKKEKPIAQKPKKRYSYSQILDYVFMAFEVVKQMRAPMRRTLKRIKITAVQLEVQVGAQDAAQCATRFGQANILVYNVIALLESVVTLRIAHIGIFPAFHLEEDAYYIRATVRLTPLFLLGAAFNILFILLSHFIRLYWSHAKSAKEEQQNGKSKSGQ